MAYGGKPTNIFWGSLHVTDQIYTIYKAVKMVKAQTLILYFNGLD